MREKLENELVSFVFDIVGDTSRSRAAMIRGLAKAKAQAILAQLRDAGWVELAEDQELPKNPYSCLVLRETNLHIGYRDAQIDMQNFKRIVPIKGVKG